MLTPSPIEKEIRHGHLFCGLGGGARGFNRGDARVGRIRAKFRCIGGVDVDPAAVADFGRLAGVPGTCLDLFDADQYHAFHGAAPPSGWREAGPDDIRRAFGGERPHIVFLSAPCKGFSGLLSEATSKTEKYQALNRLTLRGVWLTLEAYRDDPPELLVFENVPRIAVRGRALLDRIVSLLRHYGYATAETTHDCGVLGGLGQSRKRFLLVARHREKVPPFLYEPPARRLRGVGEVIGRLPVPGLGADGWAGGPMHRVPSLQWRTWVRLAFVEAGKDWRSLRDLRVADGMLADWAIVPEAAMHNGVLGVRDWSAPSGTVTGNGRVMTGAFAVADPRPDAFADRPAYGVGGWDDPAGTVTSARSPGQGRFAVADPRRADGRGEYGQYGVVDWSETGQAVTGKAAVGAGRFAVADPRPEGPHAGGGKYRVVAWPEAAGTVIAASTTGQGAFAVADPRTDMGPATHQNILSVRPWDAPTKTVTGARHVAGGALSVADPRPAALARAGRDGYVTQGHYGVVGWSETAPAVTASGQHDNGRFSVADPRDACVLPLESTSRFSRPASCEAAGGLPAPEERLVAVIRARDGTWHRPFTTLELAALQGLVDPEETLDLDGLSDAAWRERIGNAVPPPAAEAIAGVMGRTLLLAWAGETFVLSAEPIWVRPVAVALALRQGGEDRP